MVPVVKGDGSVRICGDFKVTVNKYAKVEEYPLSLVDDLFALLTRGQVFTKLDLANAYLQLMVEEKSKEYLTINTHKGLFKYNRLPFGVASAPAIIQRTMESLLQGLKHVAVCLDDILITWQSEADHLRTLEDVLGRLEAAGMRLKAAKWLFMQKKVEYLGHRITSEGIHPAAEKLRAIKDAPAPQQLRSFLGLINYFSKFLPHLASLLVPLYTLLVKDKEWSWGKAIEKAKELLTASMTHFDSCDAVMRRITLRCGSSVISQD